MLAASVSAQVPVLSDSFQNGSLVNADTVIGVWAPIFVPANTTAVETGGELVLTAGGSSSPNGTLSARVGVTTADQRLNFFRRETRFVVNLGVSGTAAPGQSSAQFSLAGASGTNFNVDDAFVVQINGGNQVVVGAKIDRPAQSASAVNTLANVNVESAITGIDLTLNATHFILVVNHAGGAGSTTLSGAHGLIPAQWGVDGASLIGFEVVRATGGAGGAGLESVVAVQDISVSWTRPTGALFEDAFGNGTPVDSDLNAAFWTTSLPQTSTVSEDGKLVQVTQSATADSLRSTMISAVTPSFNFFEQQLSVEARLSVTGNASSTFMSRGRLLLSSTAENGNNGPDNLMVGFRPSNSLSFNHKINSPFIRPDHTANAGVTQVLGGETLGYSGNDKADAFKLTLNDSLYQVCFFGGGKGSGIFRFSGHHGIPRSEWGSNGDSALVLETERIAAEAGTQATSTWDDVSVGPDSSALLAERFWDFQVNNGVNVRDYTIWLPSTERVIRGVIMIAPGSGEDFRYMVHDYAAQEAARAIGFALIGFTSNNNMNILQLNPALAQTGVQNMLNAAAAVTGRPEIANAPICITGLSAGAFESAQLAGHWPERVITYVPHRGGPQTTLRSNETMKVPGLFIGGGTDTNGATNPLALQNGVKNMRGLGFRVAYALDTGSGHTINGNQGWEAGLAWIVEVANLRYPRPAASSSTPGAGAPALIELTDAPAWLGRSPKLSASITRTFDANTAFEPIAPLADYSATPLNESSWLPNESLARLFRALSSADAVTRTVIPKQAALRVTGPPLYAEPVILGQSVTIEVDPREFDNTNALVSIQFYDGDTLLGVDTTGPEWSLTYTPTTEGSHALVLVAEDSLGQKRSALRTYWVTPADYAPMVPPQTFTLPASAPFTQTVAAADPEGMPITLTLVQSPEHGLLTFSPATGEFTYRPSHGYSGQDTFVVTPTANGLTGEAVTIHLTVAAGADANSNGLPDDWEALHSIADPDADDDGDGYTNAEEYRLMTDPHQPADVLKLQVSPENAAADEFAIKWNGRGGVRYRVQYNDDLSGPWTDVVRPIADEIHPGAYGEESETIIVLPLPPSPPQHPRRFYRLKAL